MFKTDHYTQNYREIQKFFNKCFEFCGQWNLPKDAYKNPIENLPDLLKMKDELNNVKSQLNDLPIDEWSKHTKFRDPSGFVIKMLRQFQPEILTQAWCKFYECLSQFNLLPDFAFQDDVFCTLHLCEAPGGFISALNHYLGLKHPDLRWKWVGASLNPFHEGISLSEMIPDDRLIRYTLKNWNFGLDNTGDITQFYNYLSLVSEMKDKKIGLITADGSIDCMFKPEEQESIVYFIHYCETITALSILEKGGNFVIKMFTMFEHATVSLMYLLNCTFNKVKVYKPCTSKHGNSEVYILCFDYKGKDYLNNLWPSLLEAYKNPEKFREVAMFSWNDISPDFLEQVRSLCKFYMELQIKTINENVNCFTKNYGTARINRIKSLVANYFITEYSIHEIMTSRRIVDISIFDKVPETERFCFHNRFWKFKSEWTFQESFKTISNANLHADGSILDIQLGKPVSKILYSIYYSCQNFVDFSYNSFTRQSNFTLLDQSLNALRFNSIIFDMLDLPYSENNDKFQKLFFKKVMNKLDEVQDCLIFIHIPFVTNVLVSLLFILSLGFKQTVFLKEGIVILRDPVQKDFVHIKKYFKVIDFVYRCIDRYLYFKFAVDILQIVSPLALEENEFYKCIWNYNNSLSNIYLNKNK